MHNRAFIASLGCILMVLSLLPGCETGQTRETYRGYYGIEPDESELATLDLGAACEAFIDDMYYVSQAKYSSVKLLPGVHQIKWTVVFGVSVMVDARGYAAYEAVSSLSLEAGHTYKLFADRTYGQGYRVFLRIEDMTDGKVVYGEKKP